MEDTRLPGELEKVGNGKKNKPEIKVIFPHTESWQKFILPLLFVMHHCDSQEMSSSLYFQSVRGEKSIYRNFTVFMY